MYVRILIVFVTVRLTLHMQSTVVWIALYQIQRLCNTIYIPDTVIKNFPVS